MFYQFHYTGGPLKGFGIGVGVLVGIAVLFGIGAAIWRFGWYVDKQNQQHQYENNTGTQAYQSGVIADLRNGAQGYTNATDPGLKRQISERFCARLTELHPANTIPSDINSDAVLMGCPAVTP